jgi:serine/threonine protein kinase
MNNIIHRDIKLENIMVKYIDSSHRKFIPKINDYGLSKQVKGGITSTVCGTPIFMAPELILNKPYNNKADLWSIGVMIYIMLFKDIPYPITANIFYQSEANIKKVYAVRKKKASDPLLEDLINKLLVYDPQRRLSWDEYLNHQFFNQGRNLCAQFEKFSLNNNNTVIKVYDYILEQMVIESFSQKERMEVEYSKFSQKFISIDDCLKSKDEQLFILGILGQYLELIGISVIIEKNETKKSKEDSEYDKNIIQFICNSYIWRHKYLFDFVLNDNRINQLVQDELQRCQFNEKLKKALMKAFNLNDEELIITN